MIQATLHFKQLVKGRFSYSDIIWFQVESSEKCMDVNKKNKRNVQFASVNT